jgi:hypothetical protein
VTSQVESFIRYSERAADGGWIEKNGSYSFGMEDHDAVIRNARECATAFGTHGFALLPHAVEVDFTDMEDVKARYYPSVARLVQDLTGAIEVIPFLGILRGGEDAKGGGPALSAHVDFNGPALHQWIERLMPERAAELAGKRLVNINVWRGTIPVENMPLAVCDARSVGKADFLQVALGKPEGGFKEGMPAGLNMAFNPNHQWYYFPDMQPDEALVFRLFDTADPDWKMSGHTAFVDPTSDPASPKRQSFEVRTIAVFDR